MAADANGADQKPAESPEPEGNTGYAEPKPKTREQARMPGAKQPPNREEGGLEHDPDPAA